TLPRRNIDIEEFTHLLVGDCDTFGVDRTRRGKDADRRLDRGTAACATFEDPGKDARVVTESWPQEVAFGVFFEPVDVKDLRQLVRVCTLGKRQPMTEVVADVVAAEGEHRERIASQLTDCRSCRRGRL